MTDIVTPGKRKQMMSGIRGKNTKPEMLVRRLLHHSGFRFRLHVKDLPGKPDLVLPKYKAVILINGCFWHGHDCHLFTMPKTRRDFWQKKISGNRDRDLNNIEKLNHAGWRVLVVWECFLKGKHKASKEFILDSISLWLISSGSYASLRGSAVDGGDNVKIQELAGA